MSNLIFIALCVFMYFFSASTGTAAWGWLVLAVCLLWPLFNPKDEHNTSSGRCLFTVSFLILMVIGLWNVIEVILADISVLLG